MKMSDLDGDDKMPSLMTVVNVVCSETWTSLSGVSFVCCSSNKHLFGAVQHGHSQLFYELPHSQLSDSTALDTATVNHLLSTS